MIRNFILIGMGGALGSMLRYAAGIIIGTKSFPWATLLVNISGSFIIGMVMAYSIRDEAFSANWKLFLATGICGGFTTFSAFTYENLILLQQGRWLLSGCYVLASIILGIVGVWMGYKCYVTF